MSEATVVSKMTSLVIIILFADERDQTIPIPHIVPHPPRLIGILPSSKGERQNRRRQCPTLKARERTCLFPQSAMAVPLLLPSPLSLCHQSSYKGADEMLTRIPNLSKVG